MSVKRRNLEAGLTFLEAGLTLIETAIATVILVIIVLGASAFRYNAALGAREADLRVGAARTALLLCGGWHAASDANTFDPIQLVNNGNCELVIKAGTEGPQVPSDFTALGSYVVVAGGVDYYATLSWKYVSPGSSLRALNVDVGWQRRGSEAGSFGDADKLFRLITYAKN